MLWKEYPPEPLPSGLIKLSGILDAGWFKNLKEPSLRAQSPIESCTKVALRMGTVQIILSLILNTSVLLGRLLGHQLKESHNSHAIVASTEVETESR